MIKITVYFFGWEARLEWSVEVQASYALRPASGAFNGLTYLRGCSINVNENVERIYTASGAVRRAPLTEVKGAHEATATLSFWMPDDMSDTVNEFWLLKAPLDQYNVAHTGTVWTIPDTGDSVYGTYDLQHMSIECAFNKTADIRGWRLRGCYVNTMTMVINRGENILWTYEIVSQYAEKATSFTNGSAAVLTSANPPLHWSNVRVGWKGENDTRSTHTDFTNITLTINNNMVKNDDIAEMAIDRSPSNYIVGPRTIGGTFTVNKTTTVGQKWFQILYSATAAKKDPEGSIQLGELELALTSEITAASWKYLFYNVVIGEVPMDIDFSKVQELTLPFTAQYYLITWACADATGPTNWDDQVA